MGHHRPRCPGSGAPRARATPADIKSPPRRYLSVTRVPFHGTRPCPSLSPEPRLLADKPKSSDAPSPNYASDQVINLVDQSLSLATQMYVLYSAFGKIHKTNRAFGMGMLPWWPMPRGLPTFWEELEPERTHGVRPKYIGMVVHVERVC